MYEAAQLTLRPLRPVMKMDLHVTTSTVHNSIVFRLCHPPFNRFVLGHNAGTHACGRSCRNVVTIAALFIVSEDCRARCVY